MELIAQLRVSVHCAHTPLPFPAVRQARGEVVERTSSGAMESFAAAALVRKICHRPPDARDRGIESLNSKLRNGLTSSFGTGGIRTID